MRGLLNKPITRPAPKPSGGWSNGPSTRQRRKADRPVLRFAIAALGARAPQAKLPPHRRSVMNCRRWFSVRRHSPGRGPFVRPGSSRRMLYRPGSAGRRYFCGLTWLVPGFPEFESSHPSQAVQSLRCDFRVRENCRHSGGLGWRARPLLGLYFALADHCGKFDAAVWLLNPWWLNQDALRYAQGRSFLVSSQSRISVS
jgi:hypothetical protein